MSPQEKSNALPRDTNAALRVVMDTVARMQTVYKEETQTLVENDPNAFMSLQDKKFAAAQIYYAHLSEMISRKEEIKTADPALRAKLKEMQTEMHNCSAKNLEALARMQRCAERVANTIRTAAIRAAQSQRTYSYGENGAINSASRNKLISAGHSQTA